MVAGLQFVMIAAFGLVCILVGEKLLENLVFWS
jgi:hypothetical protein